MLDRSSIRRAGSCSRPAVPWPRSASGQTIVFSSSGCGPGYFSPALVRVTSGAFVLLDLQAEMLEMARHRLPPDASSMLVRADGARLPFADASFDAVFIATVLGEIPDQGACLGEVRRIMRPGGVLAIAETRRDSDFIALPALKSLTAQRGFRLAEKRGVAWQ